MESYKPDEIENRRCAEEIRALNEAVRRDGKKWKIIGCFFALFASLSLCGLFFAACFTFGTATMANLTLSVCIIIPAFCFWLVLIFYKVTPKVFPKISLINKEELMGYGCFDFRDEWVYKYIGAFKQFDHRKIVIDATSPSRKGAAILYMAVLTGMALFDLHPDVYDHLLPDDRWGITQAYTVYHNLLDERGVVMTNRDDILIEKLSFGRNLALATVYASLLLGALFSILSPRRKIVVFDREKKTVTIPPRWFIHKEATIPFQKAVISFGQDDLRGVDGVVVADYRHLVGEVSLQFAGRKNGYCFARLIQAYMTEDDLSNHPEFETFRQIQEELRRQRAYAVNKNKKELKW